MKHDCMSQNLQTEIYLYAQQDLLFLCFIFPEEIYEACTHFLANCLHQTHGMKVKAPCLREPQNLLLTAWKTCDVPPHVQPPEFLNF